jgi:peptidoglycan/LPS O-acetylase OafA/YrhL
LIQSPVAFALTGARTLQHNHLITGWRGISVLCVIIGHYVSYRFSLDAALRPIHELVLAGPPLELVENVLARIAAPLGELGVRFFFVISGFLITQLLHIEEKRNARVSLAAFYVRRCFRIIPAFAVFLLAIWVLRSEGLAIVKDGAFARSSAFLCNVSGFNCSWWLAHTWSLSVEEQFYILWPCLFILSGRRRLALLWILFAALLVISIFEPDASNFASIAAGAILALSDASKRLILRYSFPAAVIGSILFLLCEPLIPMLHHLGFATPLIVSFVFLATVEKSGPLQTVLSAYPIQKLGLISYSTYLWQQVSTAPLFWGGQETGAGILYSIAPASTWVFLAPAVLSLLLIELPMQRLGKRLSDQVIARAKQKCSSGGYAA